MSMSKLKSKGVKRISSEANKTQYRRILEAVFNQVEVALVDELVAPDFLNHDVPPGMNSRGPDSTRQIARMLRTAFPDLHFTIEELVAEGVTGAFRVTMRGTHLGPFQGIPATGRSFEQAHMHFVRFRDGKAIEHRAVREDLGMMRQLGIISE
jgi:steroid delta-isomerase-like uncharacterized protein